MLRNCACLVIAHMVDATQLCLSCHCTHGGCYATVLVLSLHTWWMPRNCACLVIAHMSCNCTHGGCYATVMRSYRVTYWPKKQTMLQDRKKYVFFSAEAFSTHKFHCVFFFEDTNPWKKWAKSTYEPTNHTWNSTPSQHFVHLQPNAMLISLRVAITAVTLF